MRTSKNATWIEKPKCTPRGTRSGFISTHSVTKRKSIMKFFPSYNISVRTWGSLEQKKQYLSGQYKMQSADRRPGKNCRLGTKCRLQIKCRLIIYTVFVRVIGDNMSSYNLPSVMLFRDHLSQLFVLLWNIPCPFLDQNHSWWNFKPSYNLLTLRACWLVRCLYKISQLNKII